MSFKLITFLAVLATVVDFSTQDRPQTFCGRKLANTLAVLCESGLMLQKRSRSHNSFFYDEMARIPRWMYKPETALDFPGRGKRGGIIEECCINPCTEEVLMTYCAKPADQD